MNEHMGSPWACPHPDCQGTRRVFAGVLIFVALALGVWGIAGLLAWLP